MRRAHVLDTIIHHRAESSARRRRPLVSVLSGGRSLLLRESGNKIELRMKSLDRAVA